MVRLLVGVTLICALWTDTGSATETIIWQSFHSPPSSIRVGKYQDQGFVDLALAVVIKELPQYNHETQLVTLARALENIKDKRNVCHPSLYITDARKEFAYFAHPSIISPSNRLITTLSTQDKYQMQEPVDLERLMNETDLTLAVVSGRYYGEQINRYLNQNNTNWSKRIMHLSTEKLDTMFRLVSNHKVNATVSYPFEFGFFKQQVTPDIETLISLKVQGIKPYEVGSIACAKTPWGKEVINAINKAILKVRKKPEYLNVMTTWWEEELKDKQFMRFYRETFLNSKVKN